MNINYENNIIDAIELIVNKRLSELQLNHTIKGVITKIETSNVCYYVKYQDLTFKAYTSGGYQVGDTVYVLIPNNDFSEKKFILGTINGSIGTTPNYSNISYSETENEYGGYTVDIKTGE